MMGAACHCDSSAVELLEGMAKERVSPEEARLIGHRLQAMTDDFREPLEQDPVVAPVQAPRMDTGPATRTVAARTRRV